MPSCAPIVVAVDGPAGSGKSSVSRGVARRLGFGYLDTGAMYRAATWWVLHMQVDPSDVSAVVAAMDEFQLDVGTDPALPAVRAGGKDITVEIRQPDVTAAVSAVSAIPEVRRRLVERQRSIAADCLVGKGGVIVEGRDIGTTVLPDAGLKVFLTADAQARAERRRLEDEGAGREVPDRRSAVKVLAARDEADAGRAASPLAQADDAVVIDATDMTLPEVIESVEELVLARSREASALDGRRRGT